MQQQQQEQQQSTRPAPPRIKTQTVALIAHNGLRWDDIQLRSDRNLPQVLIVGINDHRRVFLRDGGSRTYKEVSWVEPQMPDFVPM